MSCLVLIHGMGQTASSWHEVANRIKAPEDIYIPELYNLEKSQDCTFESLYHNFERECDSLEGPLNLCGLSIGGMIALKYVIEHKEKVRSAIFIATQYKSPSMLLRIQSTVFKLLPASNFISTGLTKQQFINLSRSMMHFDYTSALREINCPVKVICGKKDRANIKASIRMAAAIQGSSFLEIPDSGHEVNIDAPAALAEAINSLY